jgi:anti-sigma factor RsiW
MATLDGEAPSSSQDVVSSHLERCSACASEARDLTALHARLAAVRYDGPQVDLWPNVEGELAEAAKQRREWMAIAGVAVVCAAWRAAQLVFELPFPVLNAAIPLIAVAGIAAWLVGDPLAIKMTAPELRQERA